MLPFTPIEKFIMEPKDTCDHCMHDLRLECLHMALASVTHADDLEEVLGLAECYFEFVLDE